MKVRHIGVTQMRVGVGCDLERVEFAFCTVGLVTSRECPPHTVARGARVLGLDILQLAVGADRAELGASSSGGMSSSSEDELSSSSAVTGSSFDCAGFSRMEASARHIL